MIKMKLYKRNVIERILDPRESFRVNEIEIEYRRHPLLGFWVRVNYERAKRPKHAIMKEDLSWIEDTKKNCPFCFENIEKMTPKFDPELVPEGRIWVGNTVTFPNLYPFGTLHAVSVLSKEHFLPLDQFKVEHFVNSFLAVKDLFERARKREPALRYVNIGMNYLQPAAASLVHPHIQVHLERTPSLLVEMEKQASRNHYNKYLESFWSSYLKEEKKEKVRYLGSTNGFEWIASFAPLGRDEVIGISTTGTTDFMQMDDKEIKGLAEGIVKIFKGYHKLGKYSVNFGIHSWPGKDPDFPLHIHIITRPSPSFLYCSDRGYLETLFGDVVVDDLPESIAEVLRENW